MISYSPFWSLCEARGVSTYALRQDGISPSILAKMRVDGSIISTTTIDRLCHVLGCQPGDIMAFEERTAD